MAKRGSDLATNIKLGTRVRHVEDGVEGRIVWANAVAVKIQWQDGEKVTWKRAELGAKGLVVIDDEPTPEPGQAVPGSGAPAACEATQSPAPGAETMPAAAAEVDPVREATPPEAASTEPATEPTPQPAAPEGATEAPAKKRAKRAPAEPKPAKPSALDAAARVLAEEHRPMNCQELIGAMAVRGYWSSPGGKTPAATLYAAVTMLPKWAPLGAGIKRARSDPVGDSDLLGLDLDAFHQASDDLAPGFPVGVFESGPDLLGEIVQVPEDQA